MSSHNTLLGFFLPSNVPLSFSLSPTRPRLCLCARAHLRVFFKTCVIDIETLIKCRHLWLTETMKGREEGEKKARGLASPLKGIKTIFNPSRSGVFQSCQSPFEEAPYLCCRRKLFSPSCWVFAETHGKSTRFLHYRLLESFVN